jgi:hypothetical protein
MACKDKKAGKDKAPAEKADAKVDAKKKGKN